MQSDNPPKSPRIPSLFRNWISLSGGILAVASLLAFLLLIAMELFVGDESPYVGILTYVIAPGFFFLGILAALIGGFFQRRRLSRLNGGVRPGISIDLSRTRDRRMLGGFVVMSMMIFFVTAVASYKSYHVTKSVRFCGETCHTIMEPQYVAYKHSPHAQVECTACHVGPEAASLVKSKFNGLHQLFVTVKGNVEGPIVPHGRVRIDQRTCEQCHWPRRFVGNKDRTYDHFLDDDENTPYSVRLLLKVGGGDPTHGPVGGIHWHMNMANKVDYIALDEARQEIPWVRLTEPDGTVTEFRTAGFTDDPALHRIYRMDCLDCHNRPAHHFRTPNDAVDLAIALGNISSELPAIKRTAVLALIEEYSDRREAMEGIEASFREAYGEGGKVDQAIEEVQGIYGRYFFPEMNTSWRVYPNNIGHKDWPGCFRCHSDEHMTADRTRSIGRDCNSCHLIIAEGSGADLEKLHARGLEFQHPDPGWEALDCVDCHDGSMW